MIFLEWGRALPDHDLTIILCDDKLSRLLRKRKEANSSDDLANHLHTLDQVINHQDAVWGIESNEAAWCCHQKYNWFLPGSSVLILSQIHRKLVVMCTAPFHHGSVIWNTHDDLLRVVFSALGDNGGQLNVRLTWINYFLYFREGEDMHILVDVSEFLIFVGHELMLNIVLQIENNPCWVTVPFTRLNSHWFLGRLRQIDDFLVISYSLLF